MTTLPRYTPKPRQHWRPLGNTYQGHRLQVRPGTWNPNMYALGCTCGWVARMRGGQQSRFTFKDRRPAAHAVNRWLSHVREET